MDREDVLNLFDWPGLPGYLGRVDGLLTSVADGSGVLEPALSAVVSRRGKRLRPVILLAAAACDGRPVSQKIISAAAAVELIHLASLVHDDVIDEDTPRDKAAAAILAGDYMISAGLRTAMSADAQSAEFLALTVEKMALGQAMQLETRYTADADDRFYLDVVRHKTASLFLAAGRLGSAGGRSAPAINKYCQSFGTAFQIIDDINDAGFGGDAAVRAGTGAQKFMRSAKRALKPLPDSPAKRGLLALAGLYIETSLS